MGRNKKSDIRKILAELENSPIIEQVCLRTGVARSTLYKWMKDDSRLKIQIEGAQEVGRQKLTDYGESKLLENVRHNEQRAIEFFLKHNSKRYDLATVPRLEQFSKEVEQRDKEISRLTSCIEFCFARLTQEQLGKMPMWMLMSEME